MNSRSLAIRIVCAIGVLYGAATRASAQPTQQGGGPFAGLFSGSPQSQPQILDVTGSAFGGWDDNPLAQGPNGNGALNAGVPASAIQSGLTGALQASIRYALHTGGTRNQLTLNAMGNVQDFGTSANSTHLLFQSYSLDGAYRTKLTNKVTLSLGGGEAYSPYFQYASFLTNTASDQSPVGADYGYAATSEWVRSTSATASIDDQFTKRSDLLLTANLNQAVLTANDVSIDTGVAAIRFNHNLTRKLSFHVGYGYQDTEYISHVQPVVPFRSGFLELGLGYADGLVLHFSRYYTLTLGIGTSVVKNGEPGSVIRTNQNTAFVVNGSALLSRSIGRAWGASLGYTRGTNYLVGIPQPLTMDSANAGISGPVTSRLFYSAGLGASRSQMLFSPDAGALTVYSASTRMTFALLKNLGTFAQASYYRYTIPNAYELYGFVPQLSRRSVMVGINTWLPLIKPPRVRRTPDEPPTGLQ